MFPEWSFVTNVNTRHWLKIDVYIYAYMGRFFKYGFSAAASLVLMELAPCVYICSEPFVW